jgi:hypothetical protein
MPSSANSSGGFKIPRPSPTVGATAVTQWLRENGLELAATDWKATIILPVMLRDVLASSQPVETRFEVELEPDKWRLCFSHAGQTSRIRVADMAAVDGCDDHNLLVITPQLRDLGRLLRQLERRHALRFHRDSAEVRTEHPPIKDAALRWLARL